MPFFGFAFDFGAGFAFALGADLDFGVGFGVTLAGLPDGAFAIFVDFVSTAGFSVSLVICDFPRFLAGVCLAGVADLPFLV